MNNEVKELINNVFESLEEFGIGLYSNDEKQLLSIARNENDLARAVEKVDNIIDSYYYDKFNNEPNYNYDVEEEKEGVKKLYIGNGLYGYEDKNGKRFLYDLLTVDDWEEENNTRFPFN